MILKLVIAAGIALADAVPLAVELLGGLPRRTSPSFARSSEGLSLRVSRYAAAAVG